MVLGTLDGHLHGIEKKVKINVNNGIPMPELVKIDLLFHVHETDGGHFGNRFFLLSLQYRERHSSSFLRQLSKVGLPKTPEKLSFHQNGHGIQKNDPTKTQVILTQIDIFCISSGGSRGGGGHGGPDHPVPFSKPKLPKMYPNYKSTGICHIIFSKIVLQQKYCFTCTLNFFW